MEEWVGLRWHRLISGLASRRYPEAAVSLQSLQLELGILFRALGGAHGVSLDAGSSKRNLAHRTWMEKIAGTGLKAEQASLDQQALRLPETLDFYPHAALNRDLYRWLTAMGAITDFGTHSWILNNQHACLALTRQFTGLSMVYQRLVQAEILRRGPVKSLPREIRSAETVIRQALLKPGSVAELPSTAKPPQPVLLWLDQADTRGLRAADPESGTERQSSATTQQDSKRRQAADAGGPPRKGGLLIFRPESIFSWTDYARVEHEIQENDDEDLARAADDMEVISLTRDNSAVSKKLHMKLDRGDAADSGGTAPDSWLRVPEWDYRRDRSLPDHCAVRMLAKPEVTPCELPERLRATMRRMERQFSALASERQTLRNQQDGADIDLDACIRLRAQPWHAERGLYRTTRRNQRDLACLVLADLSLSTDAAIADDLRVIDVLKDSLLMFSEALSQKRDRFAVLGFSSRQRHDVRISELKGFDERYDGHTRQRILDIKPGDFTRMGAAIRVASQKLAKEARKHRLLLLLTDGKPNDTDYYEGRYGIEDTRRALDEARRSGITTFCVTIDQEGESYLPHIFGKHGFAVVTRPRELPQRLTQLYAQLTRSGA